MKDELTTAEGSYRIPSFEKARVEDAMRAGVISCQAETPVITVARIMATYHVHSVVVERVGDGGTRDWGIVADIDVLRAAGRGVEDLTAAQIAATEVVTVTADERLDRAAQLMVQHEVTHLLVVDGGDRPAGVLSTLDVAGILAWGRA